MRKPAPVLAFAMLSVSALMLAMSLYVARLTNALPKQAVRAEGVVVALQLAGPAGRTPGYSPVVRFRDDQGIDQLFLSSTTYNPPAHRVGDRVPVIYPAGAPQSATIDNWISRFLGPVMLGGFGVVVGLLGLAALRGVVVSSDRRR
jgi:hypothetical protein